MKNTIRIFLAITLALSMRTGPSGVFAESDKDDETAYVLAFSEQDNPHMEEAGGSELQEADPEENGEETEPEDTLSVEADGSERPETDPEGKKRVIGES